MGVSLKQRSEHVERSPVCRAAGGCTSGQKDAAATFGTTVVIPSGLRGRIYKIHKYAKGLPDFGRLKPIGTIYTSSLDVPARDFREGFPGVTKRFEGFAIDYAGRFWIAEPGLYRFALTSDDGSRLYIDGQLIIDNDGAHPPVTVEGKVELAGGIHRIRVSYFQGPKWQVALVLKIAAAGEDLRVFSTDEFKPPPNPENWKYPAALDSAEPQSP